MHWMNELDCQTSDFIEGTMDGSGGAASLLRWRRDRRSPPRVLIDLTSPCDVFVLFNYKSLILITTHHSAAMINISAFHKSTCNNKVPQNGSPLIGINHDVSFTRILKMNRDVSRFLKHSLQSPNFKQINNQISKINSQFTSNASSAAH